MQAAAGFIGGMIEFTSRMQGGKHQPFRAHPFFMHSHRNASSVIVHGGGAVRLQRHADLIAHTCQMLIHRIVYNLINQMIESLRGNASDIHARSLADRLKSLQHRNAGSIVSVLTAHSTLLFQLIPNAGCLAKKSVRQPGSKGGKRLCASPSRRLSHCLLDSVVPHRDRHSQSAGTDVAGYAQRKRRHIALRSREMGQYLLLEIPDGFLILRMGEINPHSAVFQRTTETFRHIVDHRVQHDLSGGCGGACLGKSVQLFPLNLQHRL